LCIWVRAMMTYHEVLKVVRPKRKAVEEAEGVLRELRANLRQKKEQLALIENVIAEQMEQYAKVLLRFL
jgi:dynein heavy chain